MMIYSIILMVMIYYLFLFSFFVKIKSHTLTHTLHIDDLQAPNCTNSSTITAAKGTSTSKNTSADAATTLQLEVVHRQSLCDYRIQNHHATSSLAEAILRTDQLRVKAIRDDHAGDSTDLPVQSGQSLDTGDYIVSIGLGTPTRNLHLILHTGSELTWTQCKPCLKNCYHQQDPIFSPTNSTSYSNVSCKDPKCTRSPFYCYRDHVTCGYGIPYGDGSYTVGFLAKEKLAMTLNNVFPNFIFGCGHNNTGRFGKTAGVLGLSSGKLSFVSQTAKIYQRYFSYRLPPNSRSNGHLTFGKKHTKGVKFTPFIVVPEYPNFYFVHIISITVGKTLLPIGPSVFKRNNTIIDSGTVITRLPQNAYSAMRKEFRQQMNTALYPIAHGVPLLDTCYNVPKLTNITFPSISFTFEGNVRVDLDRSGIVEVINSSLVCLAFAGNTDPNDGFTIIGNTQQKNIEVVYDVAGGKIGFGK